MRLSVLDTISRPMRDPDCGEQWPSGKGCIHCGGCDSEHCSWATLGKLTYEDERYDLSALGFWKMPEVCVQQCTSPIITGFSRLTSPSSSEKGSEIALRASAQQRVLWGAPISLCHLSAERARSSFQLPSAPLKGIAVLCWVLLLTYRNKSNNNKHT